MLPALSLMLTLGLARAPACLPGGVGTSEKEAVVQAAEWGCWQDHPACSGVHTPSFPVWAQRPQDCQAEAKAV